MKFAALTASAAVLLVASAASASTYVVPGTSDPFLAGAPSGASVYFPDSGTTDTAAIDSPVGVAVMPGGHVSVSYLSGLVSNFGGPSLTGGATGPLGGASIASESYIPTGFSGVVSPFGALPINSLIGVFYSPTPGLGVDQVFEIGKGGTYVVPAGVTEFYLATVDGYQWSNNSGAFTVAVGVPEPASWLLLMLGVGSIGAGLRLSRKQSNLVEA